MRTFSLLSLFCILLSQGAKGQFAEKINVGIGLGIDYGGIGARATYVPFSRLGLFGSLGYNLNAAGYNFGAQLRFPGEKKVNWYLAGMYGYNAVTRISGPAQSKTTYYGPSFSVGLELKSGRRQKSFFNFELILPFRPKALDDAVNDLKLLGYSIQKPNPIAFSVGYHFRFK